jgi:hypothetical protein
MYSLLEEIEQLLPSGYNFFYGSLPLDKTVECVVLTEGKLTPISDELATSFTSISTEIGIFVRVKSSVSNYNAVQTDLFTLYSDLESYMLEAKPLGVYGVIAVSDGELYPLGKNENDLMDFSMNIKINYSIRSV